ncbi:S-layer homology domain-containing protein [Evansella sp. AB-rgal1]|uniref:S-layer homology domain-containing protein n=1 Tax=Evansella sp. AB-rgal1 TaxID=3242696 RepID=UPI00359D36E8
MRKVSLVFLTLFIFAVVGNVSAESIYDSTELKDLLPKDENYKWNYWGFVEYGHEMQVTSILKEENETYYSISGEVYDASGGESGGDYSLSLSYIVNSDVLIQAKREDMMLDSNFDRIELIRTPLEQGTAWTQEVLDENENEVTLETEITNVHMDDGHKVFTVRYEDPNTPYFEERQIKENVGVIHFEKLMMDEEIGSYEVTYSLNEETSGVQLEKSYEDVSYDEWYMEYVPSLTSMNIIHGYPDGSFRPNDEVTVAEFLKLILHSISYKYENASDFWYSSYVNAAKALGIIDENEFEDYNRPISREEMVKILILAIGEEPSHSGEVAFEDAASISAEYRNYIESAVELGIIAGYADNTFRPDTPSTRGEVAKLSYYTLMLLDLKDFTPADALKREDDFRAHLFPETDGNKVVEYDTKTEFIEHAMKVMSRDLAVSFVDRYYKEQGDGLYVIPKDGPIRILEDHTFQLYRKNEHEFYMTQVLNQDLFGPTHLMVSYEFVEGDWIIKAREVDSYTGDDISGLDAIHYETVDNSELSEEQRSTIENEKDQRGYIILEGENDNEAIVYVGSGEKPTGGYDLAIKGVVNQGNTFKIYVEETDPNPGESHTQVITYPSVTIKITNIEETIEVVTTNTEQMKER